ncbi:MAG: hypothetical protein GXX85_00590 [Ignavibacteria bacterium]|nr:hypothetical protein [Ignavibacteria bacterium]
MKKNILSAGICILSALIVFSCSQGDKKEDKEKVAEETIEKETPNLNLAPGTASVKGQVIKMNNSSVPKTCVIKVTNVIGYGEGTPSIAEEDEITVMMPDNILSGSDSDAFLAGNYCSLLIRNIEKAGSDDLGNWICIKVK